MGKTLHPDFQTAMWQFYLNEKDFVEHLLECVRDMLTDEYLDTLHFQRRVKMRGVTRREVQQLRLHGQLLYTRSGTDKRRRDGQTVLCLRYKTAKGRLLEGVFATDGRELFGVTVYEVPSVRLAA